MGNRNIRALVLFSGGLDSRIIVKLMQEQNIIPVCVMFRLPFGGRSDIKEEFNIEFLRNQKVEFKIIDCTKGRFFREYLNIIKNPKHQRGAALNPCIDCRIFILKKAKKLLKKLNCEFIATGEVLNERPLSQNRFALELIDRKSKLENRVLRPLSAKLLEETKAEKEGFIDRNKLLDINGRDRKVQIAIAKKYNISYPGPSGGCQLCERLYAVKLDDLFQHKEISRILFEDILLLRGFRHFRKKGKIILGKNHEENLLLERANKRLKYNIISPINPGPTAIFECEQDRGFVEELIGKYSRKVC